MSEKMYAIKGQDGKLGHVNQYERRAWAACCSIHDVTVEHLKSVGYSCVPVLVTEIEEDQTNE